MHQRRRPRGFSQKGHSHTRGSDRHETQMGSSHKENRKKIEGKMTSQTLALSKITGSTWGASLRRARHVYTAVVRPAIIYGATVWHERKQDKRSMPAWMEETLSRIQNKCLRTISGAYKATPITELERETRIAPLSLHLDKLQANARFRLHKSGRRAQINEAIKKIQRKLKGKRGRRRQSAVIPGFTKHNWAKFIYEVTRNGVPSERVRDFETKNIKDYFKIKWKEKWNTHCE